jgi:hypothetical protein
MYAVGVIFHGGECALALGKSIVDAPIEIIKNTAIEIAAVLLFLNVIFIFSYFYATNKFNYIINKVIANSP